jgi:hypothetical protein
MKGITSQGFWNPKFYLPTKDTGCPSPTDLWWTAAANHLQCMPSDMWGICLGHPDNQFQKPCKWVYIIQIIFVLKITPKVYNGLVISSKILILLDHFECRVGVELVLAIGENWPQRVNATKIPLLPSGAIDSSVYNCGDGMTIERISRNSLSILLCHQCLTQQNSHCCNQEANWTRTEPVPRMVSLNQVAENMLVGHNCYHCLVYSWRVEPPLVDPLPRGHLSITDHQT